MVSNDSTAGLELAHVTVSYAGAHSPAVNNVSLRVAPGEVVALLGPSGSGKSTLLSAIVGIVPLSSGSVTWNGTDLADVPVHKRGIGLVFQDGQLFPHRDVAANVSFGLEMAKMPPQSRQSRVAEMLELVGLQDFGSRRVSELSGGERQRVALARSLAPAPRVLLLDEPLSALDRELRERLADDLAKILRMTDTTALVVTHDADEARVMCSRIERLDHGELVRSSEQSAS